MPPQKVIVAAADNINLANSLEPPIRPDKLMVLLKIFFGKSYFNK